MIITVGHDERGNPVSYKDNGDGTWTNMDTNSVYTQGQMEFYFCTCREYAPDREYICPMHRTTSEIEVLPY